MSYVVCFEVTFFNHMDIVFGLVMVEWCIVSGSADCRMNDDTVTYGICVFDICTSAHEGFILDMSVCPYND